MTWCRALLPGSQMGEQTTQRMAKQHIKNLKERLANVKPPMLNRAEKMAQVMAATPQSEASLPLTQKPTPQQADDILYAGFQQQQRNSQVEPGMQLRAGAGRVQQQQLAAQLGTEALKLFSDKQKRTQEWLSQQQ